MSANDLLTPLSAVTETDNSVLPNFCHPLTQTDKTDKTDFSEITNDVFIAALFGDIAADATAKPLVSWIAGDPASQANQKRGFPAFPWPTVTTDAALNWYIQPSLFNPDKTDHYRANKNLACGVYALMLDDAGSKFPLDRLNDCPPSWLLETSPDNYQAGYVFDVPIDVAAADALKKALIAAGLCDAGATGGATRWMRLPKAVNGKAKYGGFACTLREWHPERRYSPVELVAQMGIELSRPSAPTGRKAAAIDRATDDDVHIPRQSENPVISALKARCLYKKPLGNGKHDITCPWVHEHTDQHDHGTAYFEPEPLYPMGGFKCQHSHGTVHRLGALLEYLNVTAHEAKHKPTIKTRAGEFHRIIDAAERALADTGRHYQRGGIISMIVTDPGTNNTVIKPVSQAALMHELSRAAVWLRYDERRECDVATDPAAKYVAGLFGAVDYPHLPPLRGLSRQPYLRTDATLSTVPGYDVASGLFGVFDEREFYISDRPTPTQALEALTALRGLLQEFPFATPLDEAATLAAILTAAIRPSLPTAPWFHVNAPSAGSGKSYLTSLIACFAAPEPPPPSAFPATEEEASKLLLATLLDAPAAVIFDNLTGDLYDFKSLCSAITEETLQGRVLGVSKTAVVTTRAQFLSSGNNVLPVRDMTRRVITITLDPRHETPAGRHFDHNPLEHLRQQRARYVSFALTLLRAAIVAEAPPAARAFAGFTLWNRWVRAALLWLGLPDPVAGVFEQINRDPDKETLARLLHAWAGTFGQTPTMVRDAVRVAENAPGSDLAEIIHEIAEERGQINRKRLGRWITRQKLKIADGMRFEQAPGNSSSVRWIVKKSVSSVLSVSDGEHAHFGRSETARAEVF